MDVFRARGPRSNTGRGVILHQVVMFRIAEVLESGRGHGKTRGRIHSLGWSFVILVESDLDEKKNMIILQILLI